MTIASTFSDYPPDSGALAELGESRDLSPWNASALNLCSWEVAPPTPVQQILSAHGYNSISYLALEDDKRHFIHTQTPAVTAYAVFSGVAIAAGEPIAPQRAIAPAIDEFLHFARQHRWAPLFFEVSESVVPHLQTRGFHCLKLGEEPYFELSKFTLKGNKMSNVRSSGKTAQKRGVTVREYNPRSAEAAQINPQLEAISQQWLANKGLGELSFTLGTLSLQNPGERRYFLAEKDGQVIAFLTYAPIYVRKGMYLDLMRRVADTPTGTMDLLITESFRLLQASGVDWATLGMAPLANVRRTEVSQSSRLSWFLDQVYHHGQAFYNYKQLYDFKKKFHPHRWESKYLAYRKLGFAEWNAIAQAIQGQSIGQIVWHLLNQPIF